MVIKFRFKFSGPLHGGHPPSVHQGSFILLQSPLMRSTQLSPNDGFVLGFVHFHGRWQYSLTPSCILFRNTSTLVYSLESSCADCWCLDGSLPAFLGILLSSKIMWSASHRGDTHQILVKWVNISSNFHTEIRYEEIITYNNIKLCFNYVFSEGSYCYSVTA